MFQEKFYGREVIVADRELVEHHAGKHWMKIVTV